MNTWVSGERDQQAIQMMRIHSLRPIGVFCLAVAFVMGCAGPGDPKSGNGALQLDGKQLDLTSATIELDAGVHIISGGSGSLKYSGTISGPGMLRVALNNTTTLVLDGVLTHGNTTVESGTLDLTKATDRSGKVKVIETGIVKRLANPADISSSLRLWLDTTRMWTMSKDGDLVDQITEAGQKISAWKSLDNWKEYRLTLEQSSPLTYQGLDAGVRFSGQRMITSNLELFSEFTLVAVYKPIAVYGANPGCLITGWGSNNSELSVCYWTTTDPNKRELKMGRYFENVWKYTDFYLYETTTDGSIKKFSDETSVVTILTVTGNDAGSSIQIEGKQEFTGSSPVASNGATYFTYYLGGSWAYDWSLHMDLKELIVTSDSKFADVLNGYIAWHNGVQSQLSDNHRYKLSPPTAIIDKSGSSVYGPCEGDKTCLVSFQSACAPKCGLGDRCGTIGDCLSRICIDNKCAAAVCSSKCNNGSACSTASGCASLNCVNNVCQSCAPNCSKGAVCAKNADCASGSCSNNVCLAVACTPNCYTAEKCDVNSDCLSTVCANGSCAAPAGSPNIGSGEKCFENSDCYSLVCINKVCADPACSPYCVEGAKCYSNGNCLSGSCTTSTTKLCAAIACAGSCVAGAKCAQNNDCASKSCINNFCR